MSSNQYLIDNGTIRVVGNEQDFVVFDFGEWKSEKIAYYKSLLANKKDLEYARAYLEQMFFQIDTSLIDGALINAAIQLLVKCFSSSSEKGRYSLNAKKVFRVYAKEIGEEDLSQQFFQLKDARNKVLAHDERDYCNNIVGLVVNKATGIAEDVAEVTVRTGYLYSQNQKTLTRMVNVALGYVNTRIGSIKSSVIEEYNFASNKPDLVTISCESIPMATAW